MAREGTTARWQEQSDPAAVLAHVAAGGADRDQVARGAGRGLAPTEAQLG